MPRNPAPGPSGLAGAASDLVALVNALAAIDPRKALTVELRFFGGPTAEETAPVLGVSPKTAIRDWKFACSWLQGELSKN